MRLKGHIQQVSRTDDGIEVVVRIPRPKKPIFPSDRREFRDDGLGDVWNEEILMGFLKDKETWVGHDKEILRRIKALRETEKAIMEWMQYVEDMGNIGIRDIQICDMEGDE